MHRFALPCLCGLALALVGACGGASPDSFPGPAGGSHPGGSSSSGGSNGGSSSGVASSSGSSSGMMGGGPSSGGMGGSSSGGSNGGSSGDDGGGNGGDDASQDAPGNVIDASMPMLACKDGTHSSTCMTGESCCVATGFTGTTATCQGDGSTCTGTTIHCGDTADCPAMQVCCATGTTTAITTTYSDVSCAATCPAAVGAFQARYQLCDPQGNDCPASKTCMTSTGLLGYSVCR